MAEPASATIASQPGGIDDTALDSDTVNLTTSETTPAPFPCRECPKSYNNQTSLTRHMRSHDKPAKCPKEDCDFGGPWNKEVNRHVWVCHADWARSQNWPSPDTTCKVCGAVLGRSDAAKRHMEEQHKNIPRNRKPRR